MQTQNIILIFFNTEFPIPRSYSNSDSSLCIILMEQYLLLRLLEVIFYADLRLSIGFSDSGDVYIQLAPLFPSKDLYVCIWLQNYIFLGSIAFSTSEPLYDLET